jgi:hypothetical protein
MSLVPCRCRKPIRPTHATKRYSWMSPPRGSALRSSASGGELAVDPSVAPAWVLPRQFQYEHGSPFRDDWAPRRSMWIGPTLGNQVAVPAQQGRGLDEEAPETPAGEQPCQPRQDSSIGWLQRRSLDLASEDCHLVTEYDDLDREICVSATEEPEQLEDAAESPIEEREGNRWMLAASHEWGQSAVQHAWMRLSAPTRSGRRRSGSLR